MAIVKCNIQFSSPQAYALDVNYIGSSRHEIISTRYVTVTVTNPDNSTQTQTARWTQTSTSTGLIIDGTQTHYKGPVTPTFNQYTGFRAVRTNAPTMSFTIPD